MPYPRTPPSPCTLWLACASIAIGLLLAPTDASAATARKKISQTNTAPAPKKGGKVKYIRSSSEESRLERDRRLSRECRGRPDAGACLGYTRR